MSDAIHPEFDPVLDQPADAFELVGGIEESPELEELFDALIEAGLHAVLVYVLESIALPDWVRELLERLLAGLRDEASSSHALTSDVD